MPEENHFYSDQAREIMGKMPSWITRWGITLIAMILVVILVGCYFIKYPQTIEAPVVITTLNPPADLITRYNGRIENLFVKDGQTVHRGQAVAMLENTADYNSVLILEKELICSVKEKFSTSVKESWLNGEYRLGDLQPDFTNFQSTALEFKTYLDVDLIGKKQALLQKQISKNLFYKTQLSEESRLVNMEMSYVKKGYERDSMLFSNKSLSAEDMESSAKTLLQEKRTKISSDANITSIELQIMQDRQQLVELDIQKKNEISEYERKLGKSRQELLAAIDKWKENYVLISPIEGKITFINYWSDNQQITSGERLASIIPQDSTKIIGRLSIPSSGFGKVKTGQKVLVSLNGFPYMQFGKLIGRVESISAVPDKNNNYNAEISFPNGLVTTYKQKLNLIQQMEGTAEIITKDMRLTDQFFDPIKSLFKNR
jgi:multidrug efflux pump subunit AcrA (membrane-fusion protein)